MCLLFHLPTEEPEPPPCQPPRVLAYMPFPPGPCGQLCPPLPSLPHEKPSLSIPISLLPFLSFQAVPFSISLAFLSSQQGHMVYWKEQTLRPWYFLWPWQLFKFLETVLPILEFFSFLREATWHFGFQDTLAAVVLHNCKEGLLPSDDIVMLQRAILTAAC